VLVGLLVVDGLDLAVGVLLHLVKVVVQDELAPDLDYFAIEGLTLFNFALLLEQFPHVEVRAPHAVRLGPKLNALEINALC
jgi:hypothetical protein